MFRNLLIVATILGMSLLGARWLLEGDRLLSITETWAGPSTAPAVDYTVGELYYACRRYPEAAVYFGYVRRHFPASPYAVRAHASWLQSLRSGEMRPAGQMVAECKAFLAQHPDSDDAAEIRQLLDYYERSSPAKGDFVPENFAEGTTPG